MSSKRKSKGGVRSRIAILLGPAGVRKEDIRWSGRNAHVTCLPTKEGEVRRIIKGITSKVTFEVSATKGVPHPGLITTPAVATASAA